MKGSFKCGRLWGIDLYVHFTFPLWFLYVAYRSGVEEANWRAAVSSAILFLALFACVLLHEYGHAIAARRYGIRTRDITLMPIGGLARLERMPKDPAQELVVALAGPLVNLVIAFALAIGLWATRTPLAAPEDWFDVGLLPLRLMWINLGLLGFNLLPAFPMDGGRVLRALLALRWSPVQATRVAARIGQGFAILFALYALRPPTSVSLLALAAFVWLAADGELRSVVLRSRLSGARVRDAVVTDFHSLSPEDPLARAVELMIGSSQQDFPVAVDGETVGVLSRTRLLQALSRGNDRTRVGDAMGPVEQIEASAPIEEALDRLAAGGAPLLMVVDEGRVQGLTRLENIGRLLGLREITTRRRKLPVLSR